MAERGFEDLKLAETAVAATLDAAGQGGRSFKVELVYNQHGRGIVVELGARPLTKKEKAKLAGKRSS